ncbi:hypothetical protein CMUS01_03608 [Colletotrichum musicola]|uniref:Uncharacterized protein n=1 Tax=Colletotrichum musicola TaxID=2175873 RepID=A0A8H6U632_9PEZI|nr:hypothetical protein CMUS01_03608 [Colletotrichum musicola]
MDLLWTVTGIPPSGHSTPFHSLHVDILAIANANTSASTNTHALSLSPFGPPSPSSSSPPATTRARAHSHEIQVRDPLWTLLGHGLMLFLPSTRPPANGPLHRSALEKPPKRLVKCRDKSR